MTINDREFDVIVWGATGFTGRLTAAYLLERHGVGSTLRWALGGRSERKLEQVRSELAGECGIPTERLPIVLADAGDEASIRALTARTRVVCTTVGPYALHGSPLVAACAEGGTHYCDLTGEAHWMRRMIDIHEDAARSSGARIVFACGFDCIPADLGTFFLQNEMQARHGVTAREVKFRVKVFSGGASGGTIASMLNMLEEGSRDREVLRIMRDPYALNPPSARSGPDEPERMRPAWDPDFGEWVAPFVMAVVDTKVVRRTNAVLDFAYGRDFRYNEAMLTGRGPAGFARASGVAASLAATMTAMSIGPVRRFVAPRLPAPGDGPSREAREKGYFDLRFLGRHPTDPTKNLRARVTGDRDPGYGSTSRMLGESAACLALDDLPARAGMLTPAAAMGEALLLRLQKNAGLSFTIGSEENG
ncbi:MAG TPA: saccharopine dehydrogenase [Deltaproteobacteria bacterium]|nr:saccharopine dehydrogenase [Deltaproteobacteria bacterium]